MEKSLKVSLLLFYFVLSVVGFPDPFPPDYFYRGPGPPPPPGVTCETSELYSSCGNVCENSCSNLGEPPIDDKHYFPFDDGKNCKKGCYCALNHIRDDNGNCVPHTPDTCGKFYSKQSLVFFSNIFK
jgi:hypothetical protein